MSKEELDKHIDCAWDVCGGHGTPPKCEIESPERCKQAYTQLKEIVGRNPMSEKRRGIGINVGDKVDVFFENVEPILGGEVLHMPQATGDSWVIKHKDGISHVQTFARMNKWVSEMEFTNEHE